MVGCEMIVDPTKDINWNRVFIKKDGTFVGRLSLYKGRLNSVKKY